MYLAQTQECSASVYLSVNKSGGGGGGGARGGGAGRRGLRAASVWAADMSCAL